MTISANHQHVIPTIQSNRPDLGAIRAGDLSKVNCLLYIVVFVHHSDFRVSSTRENVVFSYCNCINQATM